MRIAIFGVGNIGLELAKLLAARGDEIVLFDRNRSSWVEDFLRSYSRAQFFAGNAASEDSVRLALQEPVDAMVSTVGTWSQASFLEQFEEFEKEFKTNFFGNVLPIKLALEGMISKGIRGKILLFSSTSGHHAPNNLTAYAPSKWALDHFGQCLRNEAAEYGIDVHILCPTNLRNLRSPSFQFAKGKDPARLAKHLLKILDAPSGASGKGSHRFYPAWYRAVHLLERVFPKALDFVASSEPKRSLDRFRTVVITGASTGLGEELSQIYAPHADTLVLIARDQARLEKLGAKIRQAHGCRVRICPLDLGQIDFNALESALGDVRDIDLLINNAGAHAYALVQESPIELYERLLQVNYFAPLRLLTWMLRGDRGPARVIHVLSTVAIAGRKGLSAYGASKAAFWASTRSLRRTRGSVIQVLEAIPATFSSELFNKGLQISPQKKQKVSARSLPALEVALRIRDAEMRGRPRIYIPFEAWVFLMLEALLPSIFRRIFR